MDNRAQIEISRSGDAVTVIGTGEMDLGIAKDLDRALADAASASRDVTVDLRDAVFIDSAILAGLVKAGKTLRNTQARLKVLVASGSHPEYVLRTVGFGALMDIIVADGTVQS